MSQPAPLAATSDTPAEATGPPSPQLETLVRDSPAGLASLAGAAHQITVTNQLFRQLFGNRPLVGLRLREALPELANQPFFDLLDEAYRTGITCHGHEAVIFQDTIQPTPEGPVYFTFIAQAVRDAAGAVTGLLLFAYNVSAHVRARQSAPGAPAPSTAQQLSAANAQLAVANEELDVTNEELLVSNEELQVANEQLRVANNQLRVYNEQIRTQAGELHRSREAVQQLNNELTLINDGLVDTIINNLQAADSVRADGEARRLHRLLAEAPAIIAVLTGPNHVIELANDDFRALLGNRDLVGRPLRQVAPELEGQPLFGQLDQVFRTGKTYTGTDVPLTLDRTNSGRLEQLFLSYTYQATRNGAGHIDGLLLFAHEITNRVQRREQVPER